jgi:hypothetical protein
MDEVLGTHKCSSPGGVHTVPPGVRRMTVPSRDTTRPAPSVQNSVCPRAWECQLVRAPGVKRTMLAISRDGSAFCLTGLT